MYVIHVSVLLYVNGGILKSYATYLPVTSANLKNISMDMTFLLIVIKMLILLSIWEHFILFCIMRGINIKNIGWNIGENAPNIQRYDCNLIYWAILIYVIFKHPYKLYNRRWDSTSAALINNQ